MAYSLFLFLLKAGLCLLAFSLVYRLLLAKSTHFAWMRSYLIVSVVGSMALPLIHIPGDWYISFLAGGSTTAQAPSLFAFDASLWLDNGILTGSAQKEESFSLLGLLAYLFIGIYAIGFLYRIIRLSQQLLSIRQLIQQNEKIQEGNYYVVFLTENLPAFSFLRYIFLGQKCSALPAHELQQVMRHEQVHVRQKHTLDLWFMEIAGAVFWFNPLLFYLKNSLREVHEYLADVSVAREVTHQKSYANLLLKLATETSAVPLATAFSGKQVSRRIQMLTQARSLPGQKYIFALVLPLGASLLLLFSCMEETTEKEYQPTESAEVQPTEEMMIIETRMEIGKITWIGNTVYDDETLSQHLDVHPGDIYSPEALNAGLNYRPDGGDVSSLYMDHGYLFFHVEPEESYSSDGLVNLTLRIYEGQTVRIGGITIVGNKEVPGKALLDHIRCKPGDLFSRSALIESQKAIGETGLVNPQNIRINPIPDETGKLVDIEFVLTEVN